MTERRLSLRLLAYWERARGQRLMPHASDLRAEDLPDVWDDCFMLQVLNHEKADYEVIHEGQKLHKDWRQNGQLACSIATILTKRGPILEDGQIHDANGEVIKYRLCMLPLGDEQGVRAIFGGMRYKVF